MPQANSGPFLAVVRRRLWRVDRQVDHRTCTNSSADLECADASSRRAGFTVDPGIDAPMRIAKPIARSADGAVVRDERAVRMRTASMYVLP